MTLQNVMCVQLGIFVIAHQTILERIVISEKLFGLLKTYQKRKGVKAYLDIISIILQERKSRF